MVRLTDQAEHADFLNVLAAERRELALTISTGTPLRKSRNSKQARRVARLREHARSQIDEQLDAVVRRRFRGHIAVELRLSVPDSRRHDAGLGPLVKAYLDLLKGPVVFDDALVDHLLVLRVPSDGVATVVNARCLPVSIFAADYDRAFRRLEELTLPEPEPRFLDGALVKRTWGLDRFDRGALELHGYDEQVLALIKELDLEEEEQLAEDPDGDVDLDVSGSLAELIDPEVRVGARSHLERSVAYGRGDLVSDQGFDARDRPGTSPSWLAGARTRDAADVVELDDTSPGCFVLPAPPERSRLAGRPDWSVLITAVFAKRAFVPPWAGARFGGPIALDIALRGRAAAHMDIDNAAHHVVRAFIRGLGPTEPTVSGYRVYRQPSRFDDVRVRVLPAARIELLAQAMRDARELARI
jgi:hypothetical protein